ncbi:MAG: lysophospholipid acyltransferase family protein [Halothece sp. Uz-M2-17]|nr:lysophospholipid acyltransferase family protein [Halothece sp. Uz-M2-17]
MVSNRPLMLSQGLVQALGTQVFVYFENRIPQDAAVVVVSNHRSFMDPMMLMVALGHPLRTACHHYMGEVPLLRQMVQLLGCFPLATQSERGTTFVRQGKEFLSANNWLAVFPEGAEPMVDLTAPSEVRRFQPGFAHLLLRSNISNLAVLPVAIASQEEEIRATVPLKILHWFDPSEALFDQWTLHPMVIYKRANLLVGRPYWITPQRQAQYQGKQTKKGIVEITRYCQTEIQQLLETGCY